MPRVVCNSSLTTNTVYFVFISSPSITLGAGQIYLPACRQAGLRRLFCVRAWRGAEKICFEWDGKKVIATKKSLFRRNETGFGLSGD